MLNVSKDRNISESLQKLKLCSMTSYGDLSLKHSIFNTQEDDDSFANE